MLCLQADVTIASQHLKPVVSLFCSIGIVYFPLFVDEGYLLVEDDGVVSFLCVNKERRGTNYINQVQG